jgi:hypothetical protein
MTAEDRIPVIEELIMSFAYLQGRQFQVLIDSRENVVIRFPVISEAQVVRLRASLAELRMSHIDIKADILTQDPMPSKRKKRRKR